MFPKKPTFFAMYKLTIIEPTGWCTEKETNDYGEVMDLERKAQKRAAACLPWANIPEGVRHLVFFYEYEFNGHTEVRIEMNPRGCTDGEFYDFVDYWRPLYVGAYHRL